MGSLNFAKDLDQITALFATEPVLLLFFFLIETSVGFSTSVVILQEWDSEEYEVLHIYPTFVG